jgi:hypothetical protein
MHHAGMEYLLDDALSRRVNLSKEFLTLIQDRLNKIRGDFLQRRNLANRHRIGVLVIPRLLDCFSSSC